MQYIVFDLEFNQDFSSLNESSSLHDYLSTQNTYSKYHFPFEIIQIGAVKLDMMFHTISTFNRYIKPSFYLKISPAITELTSITTEQLQGEKSFQKVLKDYISFIEQPTETIFCLWGNADIKVLYKNTILHGLDYHVLPKQYINIQPYTSLHLGLSANQLLRLQMAVAMLQIPIKQPFHNAYYDAFYTSEILKKIYSPSMQPLLYNPKEIEKRVQRPRNPKRVIDFEGLFAQFEKMYQREMSTEEKTIIKLAYQMGKTGQFLS